MKKIIIMICMFLPVFCAAEDYSGPSWLLSVPTAEAASLNSCQVGFLYLEFGITKNIEIGLHGIKYSIPNNLDGSKIAIGASLFSGLLPYAVYTTKLDNISKLTVGVYPYPYFVFGALEYKLDSNITLIGEIHNGITAGARNKIAKDWVFDAGIGLTVYPYKNSIFNDLSNNDYYYYRFPSVFSTFFVLSLTYSFSYNPPPVPEVKPGEKPVEPGDTGVKPIDPIK